MPLQTSGPISLNDMHLEAGGSSGTSVSLNDADVRGLIDKPSGATSSFSEFYGASSFTPYTIYTENQVAGNTYDSKNGVREWSYLFQSTNYAQAFGNNDENGIFDPATIQTNFTTNPSSTTNLPVVHLRLDTLTSSDYWLFLKWGKYSTNISEQHFTGLNPSSGPVPAFNTANRNIRVSWQQRHTMYIQGQYITNWHNIFVWDSSTTTWPYNSSGLGGNNLVQPLNQPGVGRFITMNKSNYGGAWRIAQNTYVYSAGSISGSNTRLKVDVF